MSVRAKKKKDERPVFDLIRKPVAPPTRRMETERREDVVHPAGRKSKYKPKDKGEDQ